MIQKIKPMKYIPILYKTEMVKAIQEDRKTVTRRTTGLDKFIDDSLIEWKYGGTLLGSDGLKHIMQIYWRGKLNSVKHVVCPYGKKGDILWVRESFCYFLDGICYKADHNEKMKVLKWKPSIFMPKEACRLFLEITDVRIERLLDITEEQAIAEGIKSYDPDEKHEEVRRRRGVKYEYYTEKNGLTHQPIFSFTSLWASINGWDSVNANPWVWVVEFKKTDKPKN